MSSTVGLPLAVLGTEKAHVMQQDSEVITGENFYENIHGQFFAR